MHLSVEALRSPLERCFAEREHFLLLLLHNNNIAEFRDIWFWAKFGCCQRLHPALSLPSIIHQRKTGLMASFWCARQRRNWNDGVFEWSARSTVRGCVSFQSVNWMLQHKMNVIKLSAGHYFRLAIEKYFFRSLSPSLVASHMLSGPFPLGTAYKNQSYFDFSALLPFRNFRPVFFGESSFRVRSVFRLTQFGP